MKKLNLFLFVFIFIIQLQAQNSFYFGDRYFYMPEFKGILQPHSTPYIVFQSNLRPQSTNLVLGYRRIINNKFIVDIHYDRFIKLFFQYGYNSEDRIGEYYAIGFRTLELKAGYFLLRKKHHQLSCSTGIVRRKGGAQMLLGYHFKGANGFYEPMLNGVQLYNYGIPINIGYDFIFFKHFSLGIETAFTGYFQKEQRFYSQIGELLYHDFYWNFHLGARIGFHFGDPKFKFLKKKKK